MTEQSEPDLSVIVPVYNSSATLEACLRALSSSADSRTEIIVVDDGSTDNSGEICQRYGVKAVGLATNGGRGPARNRGVDHARSERILFVDSDVVVHSDTVEKARRIFDSQPAPTAFFGSYDDDSSRFGLITDYRNLLHHLTHQRAPSRASHFWSGLGGVGRSAFLEVEGFDEANWARYMEEVEFGTRLTRAGHDIHVVKGLQGNHLKSYTLASMIKTDLLERAFPWSMLMLEHNLSPNPFVISMAQRLSSLGAMLVLCLLTVPWSGGIGVGAGLAGLAMFGAANHWLWSFLARKRGVMFMLRCAPLHMIHNFCAAAGMLAALAVTFGRDIASIFGRKSATFQPLPQASQAETPAYNERSS